MWKQNWGVKNERGDVHRLLERSDRYTPTKTPIRSGRYYLLCACLIFYIYFKDFFKEKCPAYPLFFMLIFSRFTHPSSPGSCCILKPCRKLPVERSLNNSGHNSTVPYALHSWQMQPLKAAAVVSVSLLWGDRLFSSCSYNQVFMLI